MTTAIRNSKACFDRAILRENINNPKNYWKTIKRCYPVRSKDTNPIKLFNINGEKIGDSKIISNGFCTFFSTIANRLQQSLVSVQDKVWLYRSDLDLKRKINPNNKVFKFCQINRHEVIYMRRNLKSSKASGFENLPITLIKLGAEEIAYLLQVLANRSIKESVFPTAEKCAKVIPLYKSAERVLLDSYRPLSILPVLSKVIERLVYQ